MYYFSQAFADTLACKNIKDIIIDDFKIKFITDNNVEYHCQKQNSVEIVDSLQTRKNPQAANILFEENQERILALLQERLLVELEADYTNCDIVKLLSTSFIEMMEISEYQKAKNQV